MATIREMNLDQICELIGSLATRDDARSVRDNLDAAGLLDVDSHEITDAQWAGACRDCGITS